MPRLLDDSSLLEMRARLDKLPAAVWMKLGEARSKCTHIANAPLLPVVREDLHRIYLAKGAWATTSIEGNPLSEDEVLAIVENRSNIPASRDYVKKEVENVVAACNGFLEAGLAVPVTLSDLLVSNHQVLDGLRLDPEVVPGQLRRHNVVVARYRPPDAREVPDLMERFIRWLNEFPSEVYPNTRVESAILQSILAHLYLVLIHPFGDGNGRTARLLEFRLLLAAGVPTPAAHLLSNHYNLTRDEYYRQLEGAEQSGDTTAFVSYAISGFVDGLVEQIDRIQDQQMSVMWTNLVHETVPGNKDTAKRRRAVALALPRHDGPVAFQDIRTLTPEVARLYGEKTDRTVTRDINWLVEKNLVARDSGRVRIRAERILQMLPPRLVD